MSVTTQIRAGCDRIAKGVQNSLANYSTGTDFWDLADAAADEAYENRIKGTSLTAMDAALAAGSVFSTSALQQWFVLHYQYFLSDLALANSWTSYLAIAGFRMPYYAAEALVQAMGEGARLAAQLVFPKGTRADSGSATGGDGLHKFGRLTGTSTTPTWAATDGALVNCLGGILAVTQDATPGASNLKILCTLADGLTTKEVALTPAAAANGQAIVGQQAITGVAGAVLSCAATAQFTVGDYVLLYEGAEGSGSIREVGQVKTITANTSIELQAAPVNTITTSGTIIPLFAGAAYGSGSLGDTKRVDLFGLPDRIIAL